MTDKEQAATSTPCPWCRGRGVVNAPGPFTLRTGIPCVGVREECICGECNGTGRREP